MSPFCGQPVETNHCFRYIDMNRFVKDFLSMRRRPHSPLWSDPRTYDSFTMPLRLSSKERGEIEHPEKEEEEGEHNEPECVQAVRTNENLRHRGRHSNLPREPIESQFVDQSQAHALATSELKPF